VTLADLTTLLDYHYWARDRMMDAIGRLSADDYVRPLGSSFGSVRDTAVHIYGADWVWCERWHGRSPNALLRADDYPDVPALAAAWRDLEATVRALVAARGEAGTAEMFDYRSVAGMAGRSVFWHMLQHVVNHGSYHRGQVTTLLRQLGAEPPKSMDLIAFYRERAA
jgi:uncharacterized damage-inducible protein DinB